MIICPFKDLNRYAAIIPGLEEAVKAVGEITDFTPRTIPLSDGNRIMVQKNVTKEIANGKTEAHHNYLDIQYVVEGEEYVGWADTADLTPAGEFNTVKDVGFFTGPVEFTRIPAGVCYVVFPEDAHMPGVHPQGAHEEVKLVLKLKLNQ